ncbi:MAG: hypothetical protein QHC78_17340 [Pigmentiphaga sp.]|uniref:hypothetical protein n=1 Tax=Pigmentiphaga sp. TaxID=1977564 RepID=UPI0029B60B86|nr:hypothetical protein [Pigmentiphaga sp.]MDX3907457.1 hypothetical protein [Pigmentiphaga sp.]
MRKTQTADQAATKANKFFQGRCTVRVTDYGKRLTFESPEFESREATEDQFSDVERFDRLLNNIQDAMQRLATSTSRK